ncbi:MAG: MogA/MoaB family molybdenum cofactor biosynthesis protein [Desulfovibrionaceae bacterium]|nr:MogA/MoaB family molybdenum cofactor biosynthesis protein [Desulfovibrionaceae bacterium]
MRLRLSVPGPVGLGPGDRVFLAGQQPLGLDVPCLLRLDGPLDLAVGTWLGPDPETPLFQVQGAAWWPFAAGQHEGSSVAGRCLWLACLAEQDLGPGDLSLTAWRRGLSLAWITLSDKGAQGLRRDESGPLAEALVRESLDVCLARGGLIPDNVKELEALLSFLALVEGFDLILTTGGTGVGPRDVTPEATLRVIDKRLPGFERAMTMISLQKTPRAVISRACAGALGQSLIINLPGSPKAVRENLEAVLPAVAHTLDKLRGDPSDCASVPVAGE